MIFFFGGSRSWAAREARRKARLTAKKRRRSIIQATVVIFSLVVFSISMWSLRKMRLSARSIRHNAQRSNRTYGVGRMLNGTMKTAVSALHAKDQMPKPPLEPDSPVSKMDNSSYRSEFKKEASQERDGATVKSPVGVSTESRNEAGASQRRLVDGTSSKESSYDRDTTSRRSYRTRREDREASSNPSVRGMTQDDGTVPHHESNRAYNDGAGSNHGYEEAGKLEEMDVLDSEEGGEGLVITMPKKKSARMGMRHKREASVNADAHSMSARHEQVGSGRRHQTGERVFMDGSERLGHYADENRGRGFTRGVEGSLEGARMEHTYARQGSPDGTHEQRFGKVYRNDGGSEYNDVMARAAGNGGEHRVATRRVDVAEEPHSGSGRAFGV